MTGEGDRFARAGDYVFGLMSERERERAERDLEMDPAFRDAVLGLAARMHAFGRVDAAEGDAGERWKQVARHIAALPQMHAAAITSRPAEGTVSPALARAATAIRLQLLRHRHALGVTFALIATFVLGYLVGKL